MTTLHDLVVEQIKEDLKDKDLGALYAVLERVERKHLINYLAEYKLDDALQEGIISDAEYLIKL